MLISADVKGREVLQPALGAVHRHCVSCGHASSHHNSLILRDSAGIAAVNKLKKPKNYKEPILLGFIFELEAWFLYAVRFDQS